MARNSSTRTERDQSQQSPPGPARWDWLNIARQLISSDTTDTLSHLKRKYGDVVSVYFNGDAYIISNPKHIQHVLETNQGNYRKADVYDEELGEVFGDGLLTADPDIWQRQQSLIRPMFMPDTIRTFSNLIADETRAMIDRWRRYADRGDPINLLSETERVTLLIIGKAMFSTDMEDEAEQIQQALHVLRDEFKRQTGAVRPTLPRWVPIPHNRRVQRAVGYLDTLVYDLIEKRRGREEEFDDLLSMLMRADTDKTIQMSDEQIRDEIITFLLAGHETTATALAWTWYLLAQYPETHRRLHEATLATSGMEDDTPTAFRFDEDSFVKHCVQEGMRIYPPVPVFSREAIEPDRLGSYEIPSGTKVIMSQFLVHRDKNVWDEPLDYRPERFVTQDPNRPRYAYFPFGGGARMCIGRKFALMEAQMILGLTVREVQLELKSPQYDHFDEIHRSSAVTMTPGESIEMRVTDWE